jgi:hypothetical protein
MLNKWSLWSCSAHEHATNNALVNIKHTCNLKSVRLCISTAILLQGGLLDFKMQEYTRYNSGIYLNYDDRNWLVYLRYISGIYQLTLKKNLGYTCDIPGIFLCFHISDIYT